MKNHHSLLHHFQILIAALLLLFLCACNSNDAQIALLATGQAQQATQIAGQVTVIANVDQIAQLSTLQAQLATLQAQQATQIAEQSTRIANTSQIDELSTAQAQQATEIANHVSWISHLSTRVPSRAIPDNPTPASATPHRPVEGSVTIEDGRCCAGGVAGETIEVTVAFGAFSPLAAVNEMRILSGGLQFDEDEMIAAEWEPFVTSKRLPVQVALNWTSFNVSVQFRDTAGNLSRVSHDDISIEGRPARSTP